MYRYRALILFVCCHHKKLSLIFCFYNMFHWKREHCSMFASILVLKMWFCFEFQAFDPLETIFTNINHQICRWTITNEQQQTIQIQFVCAGFQLFCPGSRLSMIHWFKLIMRKRKIMQTENDYPLNNDSFPIYEMKWNSRVLNANIHTYVLCIMYMLLSHMFLFFFFSI